MKKALIALDVTPRGRRAGEYAAEILPALADCEIVLLVITTGVPRSTEAAPPPEVHGDEDHHQELAQSEALIEEIAGMLRQHGVAESRLQRQIRPLSRGIAQDIVDAAQEAACDTIVLGRSEASRVREFFQGSISAEVLHRVDGQAVWVVD